MITADAPSSADRIVSIPLAEARRRLLDAARVRAPVVVPIEEASGRIAARDVLADREWPAADIALIDGWAAASADTIGAAPVAPVYVGSVRPIDAGADLPVGRDAVLAPHQGRVEFGQLVVEASLAPGENALRRGADLPLHAPLLTAGRQVDDFDVAVMKLAGVRELVVHRPRVVVQAAEAGTPRTIGEFLGGACRRAGADVTFGGSDATADLILRIADRDLASDGPAFCPALVGAERVRLRIGEGQGILDLPDRLDVAALVFETLVAPVLDTLVGRPSPAAGETRCLARKIASRIGLSELALLDVTPDGRWLPLAVGQLPLSAWARARGVVELVPESEGMPDDTPLTARSPRLRF